MKKNECVVSFFGMYQLIHHTMNKLNIPSETNPNDPPNKPETPAKPDQNPDPTKRQPGTEPEKSDPTRIQEPEKVDPTRIDEPEPRPEKPAPPQPHK
ncbi:MAG: hypothetical protein V4658_08830 [Bacteroidota bacterium]